MRLDNETGKHVVFGAGIALFILMLSFGFISLTESAGTDAGIQKIESGITGYAELEVELYDDVSAQESAEVQHCEEEWVCDNWLACDEDDMKQRFCNDLNKCGTDLKKPITNAVCDPYCEPDWNCNAWSKCKPWGKQERDCNDLNRCPDPQVIPVVEKSCEYDFCADGIQNNEEEWVDCGGICEPCPAPPPRNVEKTQTNLLCMLTPILIFVLLALTIIISISGMPKNAKIMLATTNLILMFAITLMMIPSGIWNKAGCDAVGDSMGPENEIQLFFTILGTITLAESLAYGLLTRKHKLTRKHNAKPTKKMR